nr:outer membrane lipoprotein-sorting protein [Treponema sp.]
MKAIKTIAASALALSLTAMAFADQKGRDIIQQVLDVEDPSFSQTAVVMTLTEKNGSTDIRNVKQYGRTANGLKAIVMDFVGPGSSKVKGTRFLLQENGNGKDDDKFIYMPDLKSTRRVSTADGSKAFVGTDASYDDLSTRDIDKDEHTFIGEEKKTVNGTTYDCWVVSSKSKNANDTQYGEKKQWIYKDQLIPVYAELYDKKGQLLKVLEVLKLQDVTGATGKVYHTPMTASMKNVQTGHSTKLEIKQIVLDKQLPSKVFTQNFLSTGK